MSSAYPTDTKAPLPADAIDNDLYDLPPPPYPPRPSERAALQTEHVQEKSVGLVDPQGSSTAVMNPQEPRPLDFDHIPYTRDPRRLVAYLVPLLKPDVHKADAPDIPDRYLVYTPPPPPLRAPKEGEKEARTHKIQRKWQEAVRNAKTTDAKMPLTSWKGIKGRTTKGVDIAIGWTTTSNLDFLNRVPSNKSASPSTTPASSSTPGPSATKEDITTEQMPPHPPLEQNVSLEELVLVYPSSMPGTEAQIRAEFVNSMLRTKSKAQRDAIIGTGLLPFTFVFDVFVPLSGFFEVNAVWAYSSVKGSKSARSVTSRLETDPAGKDKDRALKLSLTPSPKLDVLYQYLAAQLHSRDTGMFPVQGTLPTETDVLEALGWTPAELGGGEEKSFEDEQWEISEAKDDVRVTMKKGAREWHSWCKTYVRDPEKALKK